MHDEYCNRCPDWNDDKNRFQPENRFVGDIEDGKRYPFDVYKKAEADERFAVKQTEEDIIEIKARLDALEQVDIKIDSFTASPSVCEIGSSNTINIAWSINKDATQQSINGIPVSGRSKTFEDVTTDTTYTLSVTDGETTATKSVDVKFANRIYYGVGADLSSVNTLESVISDEIERTITVGSGSEQYIIYAFPARLGSAAFYVEGFEGGFDEPVLQTIENSEGYSETYKVYKSTNPNLGTTTIDIKEV